jgi:hypothetical protein
MLVDGGRRDHSLDNAFVDRACQTPVINVQGGGQFTHLLQAHVGLAQSDCLPTTTTSDVVEITLVALFQSVVSSIMPRMAVYTTADVKCQNKQP